MNKMKKEKININPDWKLIRKMKNDTIKQNSKN